MKSFIAIIVLILAGCGYTTRGFVYEEDSIYIKPIVNKINIARESRTHLNYSTYPILLEKKLTNALVNKFNIDGHIKVTGNSAGALRLICEVRDYKKEALRYSDSDDVTEQRLLLYVHMVLEGSGGNIVKEDDITGESTYYLSGSLAKSESSAQTDLIADTARRILEAVVEDW